MADGGGIRSPSITTPNAIEGLGNCKHLSTPDILSEAFGQSRIHIYYTEITFIKVFTVKFEKNILDYRHGPKVKIFWIRS